MLSKVREGMVRLLSRDHRQNEVSHCPDSQASIQWDSLTNKLKNLPVR